MSHDYQWQKQFNDGRIALLHTGMGVTVMVPSAGRPAMLAKFSDEAWGVAVITARSSQPDNDNGVAS